MVLGDDDEASGVSRYGIRESPSEVVVIQCSVLILDDEVHPACPSARMSIRRLPVVLDFDGAERRKFDADGVTDGVDLLSEEGSEVGGFSRAHASFRVPKTSFLIWLVVLAFTR